jgi:hypothetical protein
VTVDLTLWALDSRADRRRSRSGLNACAPDDPLHGLEERAIRKGY